MTKKKTLTIRLRRESKPQASLAKGIIHFFAEPEDALDNVTLFKHEYEELGEPKRLKLTVEGLKS